MVNDMVENFFLHFYNDWIIIEFWDHKTFENWNFCPKLLPTLPHFWGSLNQNMSNVDMFWSNMDNFQVCTFCFSVQLKPMANWTIKNDYDDSDYLVMAWFRVVDMIDKNNE